MKQISLMAVCAGLAVVLMNAAALSQEHEHQHRASETDTLQMMVIGEGEMKYTCPMAGDKVFSSGPEKCPVCGMDLREMTGGDKERLEALQKDHTVIKRKK